MFILSKLSVLTLTFLALAACAPLPPQPVPMGTGEWIPSPNFDHRRANYVILHHTTNDTAERALKTLTDPARKVSSHYLIGRDGRVYHLVDERARAWHAGASYWGGHTDLNSASIGIELDNNGYEPFHEPLIESLLALLAEIQKRHRIPPVNIIGHSDAAPGRKVDPSGFFPWRRLAQHCFGLWCDPPYPAAPAAMDDAVLLQALGYNVWDIEAAVGAFKLRYAADDPTPQMTERDRSIAYCLMLQRRRPPSEQFVPD
jgi:N-acetylmuramoyl-L-alanine amidase